MNNNLHILIAAAFFLSACKHKEQVKAKIFERKEVNKNRLIIKYRYVAGDRIYIDSASVRNIIIGNDSINIIIDPANPQRSLPDFTH